MASDPVVADPLDAARAVSPTAPIQIPGEPGAVSVQQVNEHPVVYTGAGQPPAPSPQPDDLSAAMSRLIAPESQTTLPASLEQPYRDHMQDRETAALDQESAAVHAQAAAENPRMAMIPGAAQAVAQNAPGILSAAQDIGKGVFLEGGRSALLGVKNAVNETLNLTDSIADAIETKLPATLVWDGVGNGHPFSVHLTTQDKAAQEIEQGQGHPLDFWQKLGLAQTRLPTSPEEEPTTVTGGVIKNVTQFVTGMVGAGKLKWLREWQPIVRGFKVVKGLAQGAVADFAAFDGHQQRLSNVLAHYGPDVTRPIAEYLEADNEDPQLVARAKAAVEGMGLGLLTTGMFSAIRALKANRLMKTAAERAHAAEGGQVPVSLPDDAAQIAGEQINNEVRGALGAGHTPPPPVDVELGAQPAATGMAGMVRKVQAAFRTTAKTGPDAARTVAQAEIPPNSFGINFNSLETPEDIKAAISTMADRFAGHVDEARRGIRSWDQTGEAADATNWIDSMARRRVGDAHNAETIVAYKQALNASAQRLVELANAVQTNPTMAAQFAFRKMLAVHHAIQMEFMGARAEAGRALNAFKIPVGTPARQLRQIDDLLADSGGVATAQELAGKVLKAADAGDLALNQMVRGGWNARTKSIVKLVYTNSLLTGVGTAIVNVLGNGSAALMNLASRYTAPRLAGALGGATHTEIGEASALLHGYVAATCDAFRLAPHVVWEGVSADGFAALREKGLFRGMAPGLDAAAPKGIVLRAEREEAGASIGETMTSRPLSAAAWRVDEDTTLGRTLDVLQMLAESPSNLNSMMDDYFKVISARAELHAQAFRQVVKEAKAGLIHSDDVAKGRLQALVDNPSDEALAVAEREMHELTFTRKTPGVADAFSSLRRAMDNNLTPVPLGSLILPFLRTPANIISMAMRYSPLAPFMRRFGEDLAEGGARGEIAKAQFAIGSALWSYWLGLAADGHMSGAGPTNRSQKEALMREDPQGGVTWQPYSLRVGDRWWSYDRLDPMGTSMSLAADAGELLSNRDWDDAGRETFDQISGHAIAAIGQAFFDKSMLKGATDFTDAVASGDQAKLQRLIQQRVAAAIPGSSGLRMVRRGTDPYLREVASTMDAIKNTVPMLSQGLPIQRDLWGKPRTYQTGLGTVYDAIVPVQTKAAGGSAIDLEILNNGVSVSMPQRSLAVDGENVSLTNRPDIYSEFVRLAGEPAYAQLNAVATGADRDSDFYYSLSDGPTGGKAKYISEVISAYRRAAAAEIQLRYAADLGQMAADSRRRREEARGGQ